MSTGRGGFLAAEFVQDAQAVELGQHEVENGSVVGIFQRVDQAGFAVGAMIDRAAAFLESFDDERRQRHVVFNHEQSHIQSGHSRPVGSSQEIAAESKGLCETRARWPELTTAYPPYLGVSMAFATGNEGKAFVKRLQTSSYLL